MSGAVCPKCGVAVVPGYVKCPKCHTPLPTRARAITNMGGTSVGGGGGLPLIPLLVGGGVVLALVLFFALRKDKPATTTDAPEDAQAEVEPGGTAATSPDPIALPSEPPPDPATGSAAPDPTAAAAAFDRALKRERLWGTVSAVGERVDVRTGACNDPGLAALVARSSTQLRGAGLTRLRCMEQSGAVVFERDL